MPWGMRYQQAELSKHNAFPYLHFMITTTSQTVCVINFYINVNAGFYSSSGSWDNVVSKVLDYGLGSLGFKSWSRQGIFFLFKISGPTLGTNRPPIQSVKGSFPNIQQVWCEVSTPLHLM